MISYRKLSSVNLREVKLQKVKSYKLPSGQYQYKYLVTVPETDIQTLGWKEGMELVDSVDPEKTSLIFKPGENQPKPKRRVISTKLTYDQFKTKVKQTLQYQDNGMTWTQIRDKLGLDQVVPNNKWVRQLEKDIGLERVKQKDNQVVWRVFHV
jgi:hypothetical protein